MRTYKMLAAVTLYSGIVRLTDEQTKGRSHKLEPVEGKKGCYRITGPNQFKAGQEIGYDGEIPKTAAALVEDITDGDKPDQKPKINMDNVIDILDVIDDLDPDKDFISGGKPDVKALEALLVRKLTAAERDEAWKQYQEGDE